MITVSKHETQPNNERGEWINGVYVWGDWDEPKVEGLTPSEVSALSNRYKDQKKPQTPNLKRALEVKNLLVQGVLQTDIIKILKPKGYGYGQTAIKLDSTTLLKCWGRGQKKVRKK